MKTNLLLIHGAWQGAWVWDRVITELAVRNVYARALDLPGSGDDTTPTSEVTLESYARAIIAEARKMPEGRLMLVGHSMGGAAITAAACMEPELFDRLIYLCAFLPRTGESVATLGKEGYELSTSGPKTELIEDGVRSRLLRESIAETFLNDCDEALITKTIPLFKPQVLAPVKTPVTWSAGFKNLPKSYIYCSLDQAIAPRLQELMAARAEVNSMHVLHAGHEPFLSMPHELTECILRAAEASILARRKGV